MTMQQRFGAGDDRRGIALRWAAVLLFGFTVGAAAAACDIGGEVPENTVEAELGGDDLGLAAAPHCDKVTTYVCPGDGCLCGQKNCANPHHNSDFVPCAGPPVPGCEHDRTRQFCYPPGVAIQCNAAGVPVNMCGLPCKSALNPKYTLEANGCCRGERKCYPPDPRPIDPIFVDDALQSVERLE